jgi:CRP/FNR family cyclic AMP-dependent transcriptional regulator
MDPAGILLQTPILRDLSVQDVEELLPDLREHRYARGQTVWIEGDRAEVIVVLAEGQLKAHRVSRDGREVIVGVYRGVAVTGEVGLFHPVGIRWLSLSAMTAARCLMVRRAPLLGFLARHPAAMQRMLEQLSIAAVQGAYSFSGVAFDDIGRRVASLILYLADQHGESTSEGFRIRLRLSQSEFAAYVAASREGVNRALAGLVTRGVVSQRAGHFYVHDWVALGEAARAGGELDLRGL